MDHFCRSPSVAVSKPAPVGARIVRTGLEEIPSPLRTRIGSQSGRCEAPGEWSRLPLLNTATGGGAPTALSSSDGRTPLGILCHSADPVFSAISLSSEAKTSPFDRGVDQGLPRISGARVAAETTGVGRCRRTSGYRATVD